MWRFVSGRMGGPASWLLVGATLVLAGCGSASAPGAPGAPAALGSLGSPGSPGSPGRTVGTASSHGSVSARRDEASSNGSAPSRHGDGIPASLAAAARPIGAGPRFRPAVRGGRVPAPCTPTLGRRYGIHLELFAANRVVLVAPGIGVRRPWRSVGGRVTRARCYGALATIDPTGVVLIRPGSRVTVGGLFAAWGRSLGPRRILSFRSPGRVRAYVDGRPWTRTAPADIPLTRHAEIVLELGPYVPPHRSFTFPQGE
jgi:hypothetical protein